MWKQTRATLSINATRLCYKLLALYLISHICGIFSFFLLTEKSLASAVTSSLCLAFGTTAAEVTLGQKNARLVCLLSYPAPSSTTPE